MHAPCSASGLSAPSRKRSGGGAGAKARGQAAAGGARNGGGGGGGGGQPRRDAGPGLLGPGIEVEAALGGQYTHSHLAAAGWGHDGGAAHAGELRSTQIRTLVAAQQHGKDGTVQVLLGGSSLS